MASRPLGRGRATAVVARGRTVAAAGARRLEPPATPLHRPGGALRVGGADHPGRPGGVAGLGPGDAVRHRVGDRGGRPGGAAGAAAGGTGRGARRARLGRADRRPDGGRQPGRDGGLRRTRARGRTRRPAAPCARVQRHERPPRARCGGATPAAGRRVARAAHALERDPGHGGGDPGRPLPGRPCAPGADPGGDAAARAPGRGPAHPVALRDRRAAAASRADRPGRATHRIGGRLPRQGRCGVRWP